MKGRVAWNRGLSYEQMYGPEKAAELREVGRIAGRKGQRALQVSPNERVRREKLSAVARSRHLGGYRPGSGRGKKNWYRGVWCDSTYELVFAVYCLDHGVEFQRNWEAFPYVFDGKTERWIPDFRLADGTYVEIQGYETARSRAKYASFPHQLQVLHRAEMEQMFVYVVGMYGKNLVSLYEYNTPKPGRVAELGLSQRS